MEQIFIVVSDGCLHAFGQDLAQILVTRSRVTGQADSFQDEIRRITINKISVGRKLVCPESSNEAPSQIQVPAAFRLQIRIPLLN